MFVGSEKCVLTCEDDQSVTLVSVSDPTSSQHHIVQIQREAVFPPMHGPRELIQTVVRLLTHYHGCMRKQGNSDTLSRLYEETRAHCHTIAAE